MMPSSDADATSFELREDVTEVILPLWLRKVCKHVPVTASTISILWSSNTDAIGIESYENATELIKYWPLSVFRHLPVEASQIWTIRFPDTVTTSLEFGMYQGRNFRLQFR